MGGQNNDVAGDVGRKQPVEAEKAYDVRGTGDHAENER
jgi:hypothetical protein